MMRAAMVTPHTLSSSGERVIERSEIGRGGVGRGFGIGVYPDSTVPTPQPSPLKRRGSILRFAQMFGAAMLALTSLAAHAQDKAPAAAPIAPAQLDAATLVVAKVFPVGTYKRMMGETMDKIMGSMMDGMMDMPIADIARLGGLETEKVAEMDKSSIAEIMAIYDPHFRERTQIGMRAMMDSMTGVMNDMEPRFRAGLARAYARKFSAAQLADLSRFFDTPTGSVYAAESMLLYMDPEVMGEMQTMMPEIMKRMPDMMKAMKDATAHLPPARKSSELSKAEREKLARLMGVKEQDLRDPADTKDEEGDGHDRTH